jgi:hypothetical protein
MENCNTFTKTKPVGKCGTKLWLGTGTFTGTETIFVKYYLNGDEVIEATDPIFEGNNIFLDLTDPYIDFYNSYNGSYYIWVSYNGYYSDGTQITNSGNHDGFIVNFANVKVTHDRLIIA